MKKPQLLLTLFSVIAAGCTVDETYSPDNMKQLDTDVTLFSESIDVPVGSVGPIRLGSLLDFDDSGSILKESESGDYSLVLDGGDPVSIDVQFDAPLLKKYECSNANILEFDFSSSYLAYIGQYLPSLSLTQKIESSTELVVEFGIPTELVDARTLTLDVPITASFNINTGKLVMKKGFTLTFPETLVFESLSSDFSVVEGNTIVASKDITIGNGYAIKFKCTKMSVPAGSLKTDGTARNLKYTGKIDFDGDILISGSNFETLPESVSLLASFTVDSPKILGIEAKFNAKYSLEEKLSLELEDVPEFFNISTVILDDPVIKLDVSNQSPFPLGLNASVQPYAGMQKTTSPIILDNVPVKADADSRVWICRTGHVCPSGVTAVTSDALCDILKVMPDKFEVSDVWVSLSNSDFIYVDGSNYSFSLKYVIEVPLAFRTGSKLHFSYKLEDLGLGDLGDVEMKEIQLSMDFENSIPFDLKASASLLDEYGAVARGVTVTADSVISAGTVQSPAVSPVVLSIKFEKPSLDFSALSLDFDASVPASCSGIVLNRNQGFSIKNIVVSAKGGVTINNEDDE